MVPDVKQTSDSEFRPKLIQSTESVNSRANFQFTFANLSFWRVRA